MSLCVQLQLAGVRVLVVGGGRIAYRKCCQLKQEGAELVVIA
ncbi:bifunctional precorrin-2 dehydrogenase/sirohydrochlorin ferrochelatase, partial [Erysipelatoclostridium ramosum]